VDDLDLRIFRWMYPGGVWSWWGTDPRITTSEMASHVGLERTAVWARIRRWRREGFWDGFQVRSNPRIFGVGQVHVEIPVLGPAQAADLIDRLEQVDGVLWARVGFGVSAHGREGEEVLASLVVEDVEQRDRLTRVLRRLSATGDLEGPFRNETPVCSLSLTALDWRIIAAVTANPNASLARLAPLVGVTPKTLDQRRARLIDGHAIFYLPKADWSRLGCVVLGVLCRSAAELDPVRVELEARYRASIPMDLGGFEGISPEWDVSTCFGTMVPAYSPHGVHALIRDVSRIPGVSLVRSETWGPERLYLGWTNRHIAEHISAASVATPEVVPPWGARTRGGSHETSPAESRGVPAR